MAIKLEVGKRYELNNGEVHECTKMNGDDPLAVGHLGFGPFVVNGKLYHQDGTFADRASTQKYYGVKRCVSDAPKLWRDMTPEEKGALLLAHHELRVVELFSAKGVWEDCWPSWGDDVAYRVKPEPKIETFALCWRHDVGTVKNKIGTINLIDGKPDCASIKMEELW